MIERAEKKRAEIARRLKRSELDMPLDDSGLDYMNRSFQVSP